MSSASNSGHFFMSLYLQRIYTNYKNQKRQSFRSLIPHRKVKVCHLLFPLVTCPCLFFQTLKKITNFNKI